MSHYLLHSVLHTHPVETERNTCKLTSRTNFKPDKALGYFKAFLVSGKDQIYRFN